MRTVPTNYRYRWYPLVISVRPRYSTGHAKQADTATLRGIMRPPSDALYGGAITALVTLLLGIGLLYCRPARHAAALTSPLLINDVTSTVADERQKCGKLPTTFAKFCHLWVVLLLYAVALFEVVILPFVPRAIPSLALLRSGGHVCLGIACEVEFRAARVASSSHLGWRLRAALRLVAAGLLSYGTDSAFRELLPWPLLTNFPALEPLCALVAVPLLISLVAGPPALEDCLLDARGRPPPMQSASLFGMLLYACYTGHIIRFYRVAVANLRGDRHEPLIVPDLPPQPPRAESAAVRAQARFNGDRVLHELIWVARHHIAYQFAWACCTTVMAYAPALGMKLLIDYVTDYHGGPLEPRAILYGGVVCVGTLLKNVSSAHTFLNGWHFGTQMRAYCSAAIGAKLLRVDLAASNWSIGEVTNLLAVDADYLLRLSPMASWVIMELVQMLCTLGILFYLLGEGALGGVVVTFLTVPINYFTIRKTKQLQIVLMRQRDERMNLVSEAMQAVRAIKLHAWEGAFEAAIRAKRRRELQTLLKFQMISAINSTVVNSTPTLAATACFLCQWIILRQPISASAGFTSLTLFQLLSTSLSFWPTTINQAIQAHVGLQRLRRFLALPEVDGLPSAGADGTLRVGALRISNATFRWPVSASSGGGLVDASSLPPTLASVNLSISPGQLVVIAGATGCGKSSLLAALLGQIRREAGSVHVNGSLSYVPQRAQIFNQSLRDNILFGEPYEQSRYDAVIDACALAPDLELLANGDLTEIGEKGVNLSGGQQQRVNLARACYARSDIIIMDDVLSAVDAHVGTHLLEACICGLLSGRTRVLVTHATALTLPRADVVIAMGSAGHIDACGPPDDACEAIASLRAQSTPVSTPSSTPAPTPPPPARRGAPEPIAPTVVVQSADGGGEGGRGRGAGLLANPRRLRRRPSRHAAGRAAAGRGRARGDTRAITGRHHARGEPGWWWGGAQCGVAKPWRDPHFGFG